VHYSCWLAASKRDFAPDWLWGVSVHTAVQLTASMLITKCMHTASTWHLPSLLSCSVGRHGLYCSGALLSAGFTIAIPHFNTTLSRVDALEAAAVIEVLLALRHCAPRNVDDTVAAALRRDVVQYARTMEIRACQGRGALHASCGSILLPVTCVIMRMQTQHAS
jgi:hypothetical protein